MLKIVKSPQFDQDVSEIWSYIARDNEAAADRAVMAIEGRIEMLAEFPGLGTMCPHLAPGLRRTMWRDYLIYYRVAVDTVQLVRVLHARRNITSGQFAA